MIVEVLQRTKGVGMEMNVLIFDIYAPTAGLRSVCRSLLLMSRHIP
jgi:hypothetical protein